MSNKVPDRYLDLLQSKSGDAKGPEMRFAAVKLARLWVYFQHYAVLNSSATEWGDESS